MKIHANDKLPFDFLWNIYNATQESIRFSDNKAGILLAINTVLSTTITPELMAFNINTVLTSLQNTLVGIFILCFLGQVCIVLVQLLARNSKSKTDNLIYFKSISQMNSSDEYILSLISKNILEKRKDIAKQIYEISKIANKKFILVNYAIIILFIESILLAAIWINK